jgi:hypothetical protein
MSVGIDGLDETGGAMMGAAVANREACGYSRTKTKAEQRDPMSGLLTGARGGVYGDHDSVRLTAASF